MRHLILGLLLSISTICLAREPQQYLAETDIDPSVFDQKMDDDTDTSIDKNEYQFTKKATPKSPEDIAMTDLPEQTPVKPNEFSK